MTNNARPPDEAPTRSFGARRNLGAKALDVTLDRSACGTNTIQEAASRFIKQGLDPEGMDSVEVQVNGDLVATITQSERNSFVAVAPTAEVTDVTFAMALVIEAPVFTDGNKLRFSDGQRSLHADIEDAAFLARVNNGERFGKGDVLRAEVRMKQEQSGYKISTTMTVVRVLEHVQAATQLALD